MRTIQHPVHRGIVAVMIDPGSVPARLTNPMRDMLRGETYRLLDRALTETGIHQGFRDAILDHRDGLAALVKPADEIPKTLLVGAVPTALARLVAEYNAHQPRTGAALRLRVVVHSGELHRDGHGFFGESLDVAFRLLALPRVRHFARATRDPVVLVISEEMYWSIVRHGYDGIDRGAFVPLARILHGRRRQAYVHVGSWRAALANSGIAPS
jgi:hypothetical protein